LLPQLLIAVWIAYLPRKQNQDTYPATASMPKQPTEKEHPKELYLDEKWDKLLDLS
jgi:hypothetical protein